MLQGGARDQNLGHLFFCAFFLNGTNQFEQQVLTRIDSLPTLGFSALGGGGARGQNLGHTSQGIRATQGAFSSNF